MKKSPLIITKASGEFEPFSEHKLLESLLKSGAAKEIAQSILDELKPRMHTGISTRKIYKWAFALLKERSRHLAAKYHLKSAIMELGPSGFPFEQFIARLLQYMGYETKTGVIVKGKCVNHEVDVVAQKADHSFMVECKYHNHAGTVSDVKIPLYIRARFQDLEEAWISLPGKKLRFEQGWLVTNTRFTGDAITYGNCAGLRLMGWDYPAKGSLKNLIDELGVYPVTCLTTLKKSEKMELLVKNIVLCPELNERMNVLQELGLSESRVRSVMSESAQLCSRTIRPTGNGGLTAERS